MHIDLKVENMEPNKMKIQKRTKVILSLDVNGPLTNVNEVSLQPFDGIAKRLSKLKEMGATIFLNSGWDPETLEEVDSLYLGNVCDGFIGEHGRVFKLKGGKIVSTVPKINEENALKLFKKNVEVCAKKGISFAIARNFTSISIYYNNEKMLRKFISRKETKMTDIIVKNNFEGYRALFNMMQKELIMTSLRPKIEGENLSLSVTENSSALQVEALKKLSEEIIVDGWKINKIHDDFCIEYAPEERVSETHKGNGLQRAVSSLTKNKDLLILAIGDSIGDLKMKDAGGLPVIFFGLKGTEAELTADFVAESGIEFLDNVYKMLQAREG